MNDVAKKIYLLHEQKKTFSHVIAQCLIELRIWKRSDDDDDNFDLNSSWNRFDIEQVMIFKNINAFSLFALSASRLQEF